MFSSRYLTAHAFTWTVTVSGTVTAYGDHEQLGDAACMSSVDLASERALDLRWCCATSP